MDPYITLGIRRTATQEEIKKAYRQLAMKWHPDRNNNSSLSIAKFHEIADAYRALSETTRNNNQDDSRAQSSEQAKYNKSRTHEDFASDLFWEVMLDFAIKLAGYGMPEKEIFNSLCLRGCPQELATTIAAKAFNIHAQYTSNPDYRRQHSDREVEQQNIDLQRVFVGSRNILWSPKGVAEYYLKVFRELGGRASENLIFKINLNSRLIQILIFSMLFYAFFIAAIKNLPGQSEAKILSDLTLLQIAIGILSLMFVWTIYRKLWLFTLALGSISVVALIISYHLLPQALNNDNFSLLIIAISCYTPFIFTALLGNYFYYNKAQKTIQTANTLFNKHEDKIAWIRNRSGTSSLAVLVSTAVLSLVFIFTKDEIPLDLFIASTPEQILMKEEQTRLKSVEEEAGEFYDIAESHFHASPPDYLKASMAYAIAADSGSLLAAYQLGYMHYSGLGVEQDDSLAFQYFQLAAKAPLAYQPHNLNLASSYLAEAYNNLGIMYQNGYGTKQNFQTALDMYRKAVEFGSDHAKLNMGTVYNKTNDIKRRAIVKPVLR